MTSNVEKEECLKTVCVFISVWSLVTIVRSIISLLKYCRGGEITQFLFLVCGGAYNAGGSSSEVTFFIVHGGWYCLCALVSSFVKFAMVILSEGT